MLTAIVVLLTIIAALLFAIALQYQGFRFFVYDVLEWIQTAFFIVVGLVMVGGCVALIAKPFQ